MKKIILIVEDEYIIALSEIKQLESIGYKVLHAGNPLAAIDLATNSLNAIDLVLMDIDLGSEIDGTEVAKIILEKNMLPILFMSSRTEKDIVARTEKITSFGYVVKNSNLTVIDASIKMAFKLFEAHQKIKLQNLQLENLNKDLVSVNSKLNEQNKELLCIQKDLRENKKMFLDMVDNVPGVIIQFCIRPDGSSYFSFLSEKALKIFGLPKNPNSPEWGLGKNIHEDDRERFIESVRIAAAQISKWEFEGRIYSSSGEINWFLAKSIPSMVAGEVVFNGIMINTTSKKN
ncbi:MAG: response regulator [Leptospira sp.]|nr:response regulator [Leptospira sp.]NCS94629.1 response regulator [Leptospira sp.]